MNELRPKHKKRQILSEK